jgi:Zn ribbon nucleic-acid-binding protein
VSVQEQVEAKCPACGEESQVAVWRSMNVTQDLDAKELLLAGTVNVFQCPKCRYESLLDVDFLYHDMERQFSVQYYPYERLSDDNFLANFTVEGAPALDVSQGVELPGRMDYLLRPHIVFEMGELVRYVAFRDRLHEIRHPESAEPWSGSRLVRNITAIRPDSSRQSPKKYHSQDGRPSQS